MDSSSAWRVERAEIRNAQEQEDHWEREPYDHSVLTVHRSVGKESACNAGDPGLIPGSGRSAWEGTGYPFQYSWASLVAQLVKNPPAMRETWVQSLGLEDPLEKGKATHSNILAWRTPRMKSMGFQRVGHNWATFTLTQSTAPPPYRPDYHRKLKCPDSRLHYSEEAELFTRCSSGQGDTIRYIRLNKQ